MTIAKKLIKLAIAEIGVEEIDGTNCGPRVNMFCVYLHRKASDDEVFYVGKAKACERRKLFTRPFSSSHRNQFWKNIVNQHGFKVEIVSEFSDVKSADEEERRLIARFGKRINGVGVLCNLADGGEGNNGAPRNEEWRRKLSAAHRGRVLPEWHREKLRIAHAGKRLSDRHKAAIGAASKRLLNFRLNDPEVRALAQARRLAVEAKSRTREHQDKINAANRGSQRSPEACLKMSIAAKNRRLK